MFLWILCSSWGCVWEHLLPAAHSELGSPHSLALFIPLQHSLQPHRFPLLSVPTQSGTAVQSEAKWYKWPGVWCDFQQSKFQKSRCQALWPCGFDGILSHGTESLRHFIHSANHWATPALQQGCTVCVFQQLCGHPPFLAVIQFKVSKAEITFCSQPVQHSLVPRVLPLRFSQIYGLLFPQKKF